MAILGGNMKKLFKVIVGEDWETTLAGAVGAGLTVAFDMMSSGQFDFKIIGPAAGIAILGRLSASAREKK